MFKGWVMEPLPTEDLYSRHVRAWAVIPSSLPRQRMNFVLGNNAEKNGSFRTILTSPTLRNEYASERLDNTTHRFYIHLFSAYNNAKGRG